MKTTVAVTLLVFSTLSYAGGPVDLSTMPVDVATMVEIEKNLLSLIGTLEARLERLDKGHREETERLEEKQKRIVGLLSQQLYDLNQRIFLLEKAVGIGPGSLPYDEKGNLKPAPKSTP